MNRKVNMYRKNVIVCESITKLFYVRFTLGIYT